jgi:hypothetical protein
MMLLWTWVIDNASMFELARDRFDERDPYCERDRAADPVRRRSRS